MKLPFSSPRFVLTVLLVLVLGWGGLELGLWLGPRLSRGKRVDMEFGPLLVNKIFRTMEGPSQSKILRFPEQEVWVSAFGAQAYREGQSTPSPELFCHSDLEIMQPRLFGREYFRNRLSISPGHNEIRFPKGYAVPVDVSNGIWIMSQVLNHTYPEINESVRVKQWLEYFTPEQANARGLKPLFALTPHALCLVGKDKNCKPKEGTIVKYGPDIKNSETFYVAPGFHTFGTDYYPDRFPSLSLRNDVKIHYIWVHAHPFSKNFRLIDVQNKKVLWEGHAEMYKDRVAQANVDNYSSEEGILLRRDGIYRVEVDVDNTENRWVDCMGALYLFVADAEGGST